MRVWVSVYVSSLALLTPLWSDTGLFFTTVSHLEKALRGSGT